MPPPKVFNKKRMSLRSLRWQIQFTHGKVSRQDLIKAEAPAFLDLIVKTDATIIKEQQFLDEINAAQLAIYLADDDLNDFAHKVWRKVEDISVDPKLPIRTVLFGDKTLAEFNRPTLNTQYTAMSRWPDALKDSGHPQLAALAPEAPPLVEASALALERKAKAQSAKKIFREVGDHAKLFDEVNLARKKLYFEASSLPHTTPGLPANFADRLFARDVVEDEKEDETPTEATIEQKIETLEADIIAKQEELEKLKKDAADLAKTAAERKALEERLAELDNENEARKKERDAILEKLKKE